MTSLLKQLSRIVQGVRILGAGLVLQCALYPFRKAYYSAKFRDGGSSSLRGWLGIFDALRRPQVTPLTPADCTFAGAVREVRVDGHTVELTCEKAAVQLTVLAEDLIRVRLSPTGRFPPPFSYAVDKEDGDWPAVDFTVHESDETIEVRTARLTCRVMKTPLRLIFVDPHGEIISADEAGMGWRGERVAHWRQIASDEHLYGLGEKTVGLDKRGLAFEMWNRDPQTYSPGDDPIYLNTPFLLGLRDGRGYGIFYDNTFRSWFDLGAERTDVSRFEAEGGELRYYFFYGPALTTVLDRYTELTGRMIMPPLWALGYHQNRWSYYPESRVREIAHEFRARRIPCDNIHLDIHYMDGYRCFTWDRNRFPDPAQMIADLKEQGFKTVAMIDAGIKADPKYWVCAEGLEQGMFCTYPDGQIYGGPVWPGECHFPDFTSPRVRAWWGELYRGLVEMGVAGVWNDMNEPVVMGFQGDTFPDCVRHDWEGQGADHRQAHNVYGMQMARATAEGLTRLRPEERPLVITRSAWAGAQRYCLNWTADNQSTWPQLKLTMPMVMTLGLGGMAFSGPDTGGFEGTPDGELLTRWMQLGAFTPFFRNHTHLLSGDQEPWVHGEPYTSINRRFVELRYQLLPYVYTAFWQCAQSGLPILRPLMLHWQDDPRTHALDDEFMFGDALLVAPVYEPGATSRPVYLPAGTWYDFWSDKVYAGERDVLVDAPLERMPLFVRAGSVIPMWPLMQYVGEREVDVLTLHVYPGDGESWLYEDDGHSWAFRLGEYRLTRFALRRAGDTLELHCHGEGAYTPTYDRCQVVVHSIKGEPLTITADGLPVTEWVFDAETRTLRLAWRLTTGGWKLVTGNQ
ncbi:MAG: glycoside hydrolase family 31 protein [Anaerolineae bacterium]|nr:glycoside hydrolase family 31 protein [Anaerolineae bacterium]